MEHSFENLGANRRGDDDRDFGSVVPPAADYPTTFIQDVSSIPVEYQGKNPTCGAHAAAFFQSVLELNASKFSDRHSPQYPWIKIKQIDNYDYEDGTDMRSMFKELQNSGVCKFSLLGDDLSVSLKEYSSPKNITNDMNVDATLHKIGTYHFPAVGFEDIKREIYHNKAVIALIRIGNEWWTSKSGAISWAEQDVLPIRPVLNAVSGHFIVFHSYDENFLYFRNHWSERWGREGNGYLGKEVMHQIIEIGTASLPTGNFIFTRDLSYGSVGQDVVELQKRLGISPTFPIFGPKTKAAVIAYQNLNGIPQTGYFGPLTRAALNK